MDSIISLDMHPSFPGSSTSTNSGGSIPSMAPGSNSAPIFKGQGIESFIEIYDMITMKNTGNQKTLLFPYYCDKSLTSSLIKTKAYESRDWDLFKFMLIDRFKKDDDDESFSSLEKLVSQSFSVDGFEEFIYSFDYICAKLVASGSILISNKSKLLIKAMPKSIIDRIGPKLYMDNGKLIDYTLLSETLKKEVVYQRRLQKLLIEVESPPSIMEKSDKMKQPAEKSMISFNYTVPKESKESRIADSEDKDFKYLVDKMSAMSLAIKRIEERTTQTTEFKGYQSFNKPQCAYCDKDHAKRDCKELDEALQQKLVKIGERGMIIDMNGNRYPLNYNNGEIKSLIQATKQVYGKLMHIERDADINHQSFESNMVIRENEFNELVNTYAASREKHKDSNIYSPYNAPAEKKRGRKPCISKTVGVINDPQNSVDTVQNIPVELDSYNNEMEAIERNSEAHEMFDRPYKMKANIVEVSLQEKVFEKCKSSKIELSLQELASVSPMVRKSLNDDFRQKRIVITDKITTMPFLKESYNKLPSWRTEYLAVGSGRIIGKLQGAEVQLLFDEGSEINVMSSAVYKALESLGRAELDESVNWNLVDANQGSSKMAGVCKEIIVEIEGSAVKVPIFVSDQTKTPVILGRPWDIKSRVLKDNRSDGSLWYTIRDENSGAARTFCVNDEKDKRRFEDAEPHEKDRSTKTSSIMVCNSIYSAANEYNTEVQTRYKNVANKVKPAQKALKEIKSPEIQDKDKTHQSDQIRLTEERLKSLVVGDGELTPTEQEYLNHQMGRIPTVGFVLKRKTT
ncbi:hypothetical protein AYI70_g4731 [Smittium culicis]|uniref:Uncharacterized protein n=1 Tax=Smittium culicis TaxID=133412 RepID=A0A1R1XY50_9FUNG|nr:hypothetical protein AYI70_g4731 [Smittium culicis]